MLKGVYEAVGKEADGMWASECSQLVPLLSPHMQCPLAASVEALQQHPLHAAAHACAYFCHVSACIGA